LPQSDPRIQYQQCSRLTLDCTAPLPFHLDGEVYGAGCLDTRYTTFITSTQRMTVSLAGPSG
ncbi:MAG: hypothetical protein KDB22_07710, partial [Planctomycetales bacterium]|nr:hypothetical protein [Planctomycetales bacterium]